MRRSNVVSLLQAPATRSKFVPVRWEQRMRQWMTISPRQLPQGEEGSCIRLFSSRYRNCGATL